jgi:hypothetical protein
LLGLIIFPEEEDALSFAHEAASFLYSDENDGDLVISDRVYESMNAAIQHNGAFNKSDVCGLNTSNLPRDCFLIVVNVFDANDYIINYNRLEVHDNNHMIKDY